MRAPPRRSTSPYLDVLGGRLFVFMPAVMSLGFVFWVAALVRDQVHMRRAANLDLRAASAGRAAANATLGTPHMSVLPDRVRARRRSYVLTAVPFLAASVFVLIGGVGNYVRSGGYLSEIAWILAIAVAFSLAFGWVGVVLILLGHQWPSPSDRVLRFARRTPFVRLHRTRVDLGEPSSRLNWALLIVSIVAALTAMIVGSSRGFLSRIDQPVLDAASDAGWLGALSHVDLVGSTPFAIVAAGLLGLASFRCRVLIAAYPLAFVAAFAVSNLLRELVERPRPPGGSLAGGFDSFPSGHIVIATILVGLLPLTAAVMLHSTRVIGPLRLFALVGIVLAAAHRVHDESHWPTDVFAGAVIGGAIVLAVEWAIAHEAWHRRCTSCPWALESAPVQHATIPLRIDVARLLGLASHIAAAGVAILLAILSVTRGLPADPEGILLDPAIQRPVQLGLAGLVSIGALVSWRFPAVGAVLLAFAAVGLGTFASLQFEPRMALALTALIVVPAVLLWLSWQHRRRHGEIVALAAVTTLLLTSTWVVASFVYGSVFGPTHEDSAAAPIPIDHVEWVWLGALGPESISATVRVDDADLETRMVVTGGEETWSSEAARPLDSRAVRLDVDGLRPDQRYEYVIEVDGRPDLGRGRGTFRTPASGPASFRLVSSSCARVGSNAAVFDAMAEEDPLLYLALGDVHYSNIADNDPDTFATAYDRMLTQPGQAAFYRSVPVSYVWDDHDYGPNDSDADSPSRDAARQAFREQVPSHSLVSNGAIHRAFTIGRVRFVVTDTRSERRGDSMLGAEQLAWFEDEIVTASRTHALVLWMNPSPWIGEANPSGDGWAGFADERRHIADVLSDADVDNLLMVSGDAHMLAFDDGSNSGYASDGSPGFAVFHTAALDRPGSLKGGPYSGGGFAGFGQYGIIDVDDDGRLLEVRLTGKNWKGDVIISERLQFPT